MRIGFGFDIAQPRTGGGLGPELVVNGSFDGGTSSWIVNPSATAAVIGGEMRLSTTSGSFDIRQSIPTVSGKVYRVSALARRGQATGAARLSIVTRIDGPSVASESMEFVQFVFTASSTTSTISLNAPNGNGDYFFDNISVREVL